MHSLLCYLFFILVRFHFRTVRLPWLCYSIIFNIVSSTILIKLKSNKRIQQIFNGFYFLHVTTMFQNGMNQFDFFHGFFRSFWFHYAQFQPRIPNHKLAVCYWICSQPCCDCLIVTWEISITMNEKPKVS